MNYILICDDMTDNCILLQFLLEAEGYKADFVTSGVELIEKIKLQKPNLLLLDVMMPETSGVEVVKLLREDKFFQNLAILLITAYPESLEPELSTVEVDGIIHKPVDPDLLIKSVQDILQS